MGDSHERGNASVVKKKLLSWLATISNCVRGALSADRTRRLHWKHVNYLLRVFDLLYDCSVSREHVKIARMSFQRISMQRN